MKGYKARRFVDLLCIAILVSLFSAGATGSVRPDPKPQWTRYLEYVGFEANPYGDYLLFRLEYQSLSELEITGIKVKAQFIDPFGDVLQDASLSFTEMIRIAPGERRAGELWYAQNPFQLIRAQGLLGGSMRYETLQARIHISRIAFADGTVLDFGEEPNEPTGWALPIPKLPLQESGVPDLPTGDLPDPSDIPSDVSDIEMRIATLEAENVTLREMLLTVESRIEILEDVPTRQLLLLEELINLVDRVNTLETSLEIQHTAITFIQEVLESKIPPELNALRDMTDSLDSALRDLQQKMHLLEADIAALRENLTSSPD